MDEDIYNARLINRYPWSRADYNDLKNRLEEGYPSPVRWVQRCLDLLEVRGDGVFYKNLELISTDRIPSILQPLYRQGLYSRDKLYSVVKQRYLGISRQAVVKFLNNQEGVQIYKPLPNKKERLMSSILTQVKKPYDRFQIDFIDLLSLKTRNNGYAYILCIIDVFSRYAWVIPTKTRNTAEYVPKLRSLLDGLEKYPRVIQADNEFRSRHFQDLFSQTSKVLYSAPYNPRSNGIIERFNGTLKRMLFRSDSKRWLGNLQPTVGLYNSIVHSTTKHTPESVLLHSTARKTQLVDGNNRKYASGQSYDPDKYGILNPGDSVRVASIAFADVRKALLFRKSTVPRWTNEIYTVSKVGDGGKRVYLEGESRPFMRSLIQVIDADSLEVEPVPPPNPRRIRQPPPLPPPARSQAERDPLGMVGVDIRVWWSDLDRWEEGKVKSYSLARHRYIVTYQTFGDVWENLEDEVYEKM